MTFFSPFPPFRPQAVGGRDGRPRAETGDFNETRVIHYKVGPYDRYEWNGNNPKSRVKTQLSTYKAIYRGYNSIYNIL